MITGNTFAKYFQTVLRILRTYSEDTTLELIDFMSSDEAVLKWKKYSQQIRQRANCWTRYTSCRRTDGEP